MDPVAYTFEGVGLMVAFEYFGLQNFKYSLRKISEIVVNVLVGHLLEVESAIADSKNMLNVCHRNLQVCPAHLQNFLPETQQVQSQLVSVFLRNADCYYFLEDYF